MKAQKDMIWKVTIEWKGEEVTYTLDSSEHIGKWIKGMKEVLKGCKVVERWQEPK